MDNKSYIKGGACSDLAGPTEDNGYNRTGANNYYLHGLRMFAED